MPVQLIDPIAYGCGKCSFDICLVCYGNLPAINEIIPQIIDNKALLVLAVEEDVDSESDWKDEEEESYNEAPRKRIKKK